MTLKSPGPLVPGVFRAKPVIEKSRLCTGANTADMNMAVFVDFTVGLEVSAGEADLYLHWASDLLTPATDDDNDDSS